MDSEEREVGVNSVGDGQDREWVEESQRIGNVVNTWKLHWISESKMMNTRNSYYNKRKNSRQIGRELGGANWRTREEANWARTTDGQRQGKRLRAVKWNVGELAMNCPASDSRI